jgi:hypothetical protein
MEPLSWLSPAAVFDRLKMLSAISETGNSATATQTTVSGIMEVSRLGIPVASRSSSLVQH